MHYGLSTSLFVEERLNAHILDKLLAAGAREFEIMAMRPHLDYYNPNQVRDVAEWFSDHGLTLHSLHAPISLDGEWARSEGFLISVAYLERRLRVASMDEIKRAIAIAEQLPFRYLVLHLGLPNEEFDPAKIDAAFTSIEHLKIFAKERGVQLLLENIPSELSSPKNLLKFFQYTRLELKICFDTGHAHLASGVQPAFRMLRERTAAIHVHDNHGEKDEHLLPFEGEIDWAQTVRDFRSLPGELPLIFELNGQRNEPNLLARVNQVMDRFEKVPSLNE